jgi:hypothetical protein
MNRFAKWIRTGVCCVAMVSTTGIAIADDPVPAKKSDEPIEQKRFDLIVREDIFAGFSGDTEALGRGDEECNKALKANPKNAEAMVWSGAISVFRAGMLFGQNKPLEAFPLWTAGLKRMDDAVKLEPDNVGVRIPRASVLLPSARNAPEAMAKPLLKSVLEDFEYIYKKQADHLDDLGEHPRGELRMGLADTYRLLGQLDKSKEQLDAIAKELPETEYASEAKKWLASEPTKKLSHNCIGCHSK